MGLRDVTWSHNTHLHFMRITQTSVLTDNILYSHLADVIGRGGDQSDIHFSMAPKASYHGNNNNKGKGNGDDNDDNNTNNKKQQTQ